MRRDFAHVRFISAGAGSGKTYRLTQELERALTEQGLAPGRVIGTTFTVKAAGELRERVRARLIESGRAQLAEQMSQALIGTVHSVCERLLKRFAFALGLSPELEVASLEDAASLFAQALDEVLSTATVRDMNALLARLDLYDTGPGSEPRGWRDDVQRLASEARNNDIDAAALPPMGRASAAELLAFFPAARGGAEQPLDRQLLDAVHDALAGIDLSSDTTAGTRDYVELLRGAIYRLRRGSAPWSDWIRLSKAKATKKSEPRAAPVRAAAAAYDRHPRLHEDLRRYIEQVFAIAAQALARFQALKRERGLIDFTDMEQLVLHALEVPAVREELAEAIDLLLVDEFQDTNPMQLAIFMKLAALARQVILVGDVKQAIYAFRGCDPELVFATLEGLTRHGGTADVLPRSWRSRPALVHYVNAVFTQAFAGEIAPGQIALTPQRTEQTDTPAVLHWTAAGDGERRATALAHGLAALVAAGPRIVDPLGKHPRPLRWGDIAVLASSNRHVEQLASALRRAQIPMKMTLEGLLSVPEICLAKACLRRLNDRSDTLATAEIIALADCSEPEQWLAGRLRWLAGAQDGAAWAEDSHAIVAGLARLREDIVHQSPVEIVARVLNYVGIREVVTAWGPNAIAAAQRQRNLDALLQLAVEYERHCAAQHLAATLTGFLFWLENPHSPELDLQPVVTTGEAVHVLTYHRAKGLEWPVVIATDFQTVWRSRLWDIRIDSPPPAAFDLADPLAGRTLRFWPPVFGKHTQGLPVLESILGAAAGQQSLRRSAAETRRLAYVGMTRARDMLVLVLPEPTRKDGTPAKLGEDVWLRAFMDTALLPAADQLALPDGTIIPTARRALADDTAAVAAAEFQPRRLPARPPARGLAPERLSPSSAAPLEAATIEETVELGPRLALAGDDLTAIGTALHAVIAAELLNPARPDALARAAALLHGARVAGFVTPAQALQAAQTFAAWLDRRFGPGPRRIEYPITHAGADGRIVRGWIDVLIETPAGWVVIDHKSSPRPRSEWPAEAREHAGQLALYRAALEATGRPVAACWLHFPVSGGLVRVGLPPPAPAEGAGRPGRGRVTGAFDDEPA